MVKKKKITKKKITKKKEVKRKDTKEIKIKVDFGTQRIISDDSEAKNLYEQSRFGEVKEGSIQYSLVEALYLLEKRKMDIYQGKKKLKANDFLKMAQKLEPNFWVRYVVFKDMRNRGYIIKTALKFGADFRVYDRGIKPGEDHAKWILYPIKETYVMPLYEFAAKNRVAHSTRKRLLVGIVDEESDVTYYTVAWTRP